MKWLSKIFKIKPQLQQIKKMKYPDEYFKGEELYKIGRELSTESLSEKLFSPERRKQKIIAALEFFDKAIEKGYDEPEVYSFRGICLRDLNFDIDALDDFNQCIDKNPDKANFYYSRAMTKEAINDFAGSLIDFKKAIELSMLDNEDTRYWNNYAKQTGYESATRKYELDLQWLMQMQELYKNRPNHFLEEKMKNIKRRNEK